MDSLAFDAVVSAVAEQATNDAISVYVDGASGETEEPLSRVTLNDNKITIEDWQFKIGQCISHKDQSLPSLVMARVRTTKGREVYGVRSFKSEDTCRDRMILGESLVDVIPGSDPCKDCLLWSTGMCPGDKRT